MRLIAFLTLILLTACRSHPSTGNSARQASEPPLRVASGEPESLDPRLIRSSNGVTAVGLFYEGLLRHDYLGRVVHGIADKIETSPDKKTWTIQLKKVFWSNGDPLTSRDLRDTWLTTLSPSFPAPNAYQLYVIRGAQKYKEGTEAANAVGIAAPDDATLIVQLKEPVPYFSELLSSPFFYPVHESNRSGQAPKGTVIGNGPFILDRWALNNSISAKKNPHYWDKDEVRLDEVELVFVDDTTALNMFLSDSLDWVGSPSGNIPIDAVKSLESKRMVTLKPAAATSWFRINTTRPLLNDKKFRQALYYALDRKAIAHQLLQGKQMAAPSIVPPFWLEPVITVNDSYNPGKAWELFQQALEEVDADRDSFKSFTICYKAGERAQKVAQAVQQQWEKTLGIKITLEQCEGMAIFSKWTQLDYDIALGSWVADIEDPINFLEVFSSKTTPTNNTGWENADYQKLLQRSYLETGDRRMTTLQDAQRILIDDAPVIPIYFHNYLYAKKPSVHGVWLSKLGFLDFKYAFINDAALEEPEPME